MNRALALWVLLATGCSAPVARDFDDGVFVSRADPPMRVRIAERFEYLGPETFLIGTTHEAERHHWVETDGGRVTALIVFQFERILDGVEGQYEFNVPSEKYIAGSNYQFAPEPVALGGHAWVHNTWAFDTYASARENPGKESDRTLRLLRSRGYDIDPGLVMARYVRAVGADMRREVILFYMEPLSRHGHAIADFPEGGPRSDTFDHLSATLVARAREAFAILD